MIRIAFLTVAVLTATMGLCFANTKETQDVKAQQSKAQKVIVDMSTSKGNIKLELYPDKAPKTVENFLAYAKAGHYNNTIFHRVIDGFMIQGGGFTADMQQKPTKAPISNEAANGLTNERGTIAMARTMDVNSATAQFFINTVNNTFLNYRDNSPSGFGYCVFGKVVEGMDVIDKIGKTKTGMKGQFSDVPVETITINSVTVE